MRKSVKKALVVLLILILPCYALADATLGGYTYGPWSDWGTRKIVPNETLDVESRTAREVILKDQFTYERFVYFNMTVGGWYATNTDQPAAMVRPGSGRWETKKFDAAKRAIGSVGGQTEYEGHWFNETVSQVIDRFAPVTQYRSRSKVKVLCELSAHDLALAVGETHKLSYKLADGVGTVSFASSDTSIASVSSTGSITAHAMGSCEITVVRGDEIIECARLSVGERVTTIQDGIYSISLAATGRFLAPRAGRDSAGTIAVMGSSVRMEKRLFRFEWVADGSYRIRLVSAPILYLYEQEKGSARSLRLGTDAQSEGQAFELLRMKGDRYLVRTAGGDRYLGAGDTSLASLRPLKCDDPNLMLSIQRESDDAVASGNWIAPVVRNGQSQVSQNFDSKDHKGVDLGSKGERVSVVAVAAGRVVYAFSGCTHDYPKKAGKNGALEDPCGAARTFGNVVIVEHEGGLRTTYAHLSRVKVKEGDKVAQGQVLGLSGSTGASRAVHLHFEVRRGSTPLNPRLYIDLPKLNKKLKVD